MTLIQSGIVNVHVAGMDSYNSGILSKQKYREIERVSERAREEEREKRNMRITQIKPCYFEWNKWNGFH